MPLFHHAEKTELLRLLCRTVLKPFPRPSVLACSNMRPDYAVDIKRKCYAAKADVSVSSSLVIDAAVTTPRRVHSTGLPHCPDVPWNAKSNPNSQTDPSKLSQGDCLDQGSIS